MLIQAAAAAWSVPAGECSAANSVITHTPSGRTTTYGKVADGRRQARAAERRQAQGPEGLEDRRQAAEAARHAGQGQRQAGLRHRPQAAGHAERGDPRLPGVRRQAQELRRRQGREDARASRRSSRSATPPSRSSPTRCWHAKTALAALPIVLGRGAERHGQQRRHRGDAEGGARRQGRLRRQQGRRRQGGARRRREDGRGGLQLSRTSTTPPWSR